MKYQMVKNCGSEIFSFIFLYFWWFVGIKGMHTNKRATWFNPCIKIDIPYVSTYKYVCACVIKVKNRWYVGRKKYASTKIGFHSLFMEYCFSSNKSKCWVVLILEFLFHYIYHRKMRTIYMDKITIYHFEN